MSKQLFDAIKTVLAARQNLSVSRVKFTQAEVDAINRALMGDVAEATEKGMRLSARGRKLIEEFESYRATTYPDPGPTGLPVTGGWGTTRDENGRPFKLGRTESEDYWRRLKERDLAEFEAGVNLLISGGAPTSQNQFDALVSFAYNVGLDIDNDDIAEGLGDSTLLKRHRAGEYANAQRAFHSWVFAKSKKLNGLVRRREAEANLYGAAT